MNVSGHRLSTIEIESALVDHPKVAEAAVVGRADEPTGQAIAAFVTLTGDATGDEGLSGEDRQLGDVTTLADEEVVRDIADMATAARAAGKEE